MPIIQTHSDNIPTAQELDDKGLFDPCCPCLPYFWELYRMGLAYKVLEKGDRTVIILPVSDFDRPNNFDLLPEDLAVVIVAPHKIETNTATKITGRRYGKGVVPTGPDDPVTIDVLEDILCH